jgi:hypothetical protein
VTPTGQPTTGKAAAAAAAKTMLQARINLVTALGDAIDNHRRATDAVTTAKTAQETAAEAARAAHAHAVAGGWTPTELRNAGLITPPAPRRKNTAAAHTEHSDAAPSDTTEG